MRMSMQRTSAVISLFLILTSLLCVWSTATQAANTTAATEAGEQQGLSLQHIKGNLYRFSRFDADGDNASGVILVGTKGVAVGDPLDIETATALNDQIKAKFDLPVLYVFYTHASAARAAGAALFVENGATLVAHANSVHSSAVLDGSVPTPALVFKDTLSLNLNDSWVKGDSEQVELRYLGKNLSDDMIIAYFPQYEAVFASDFVAVESLPLQALDSAFFPDWFSAIDKLNRIEYSYLLAGRGKLGIRSDAIEHGRYLRELHNRVSRRVKQGQTEETIVAEINLRRFQKWQHYEDVLANNVREMVKIVTEETP